MTICIWSLIEVYDWDDGDLILTDLEVDLSWRYVVDLAGTCYVDWTESLEVSTGNRCINVQLWSWREIDDGKFGMYSNTHKSPRIRKHVHVLISSQSQEIRGGWINSTNKPKRIVEARSSREWSIAICLIPYSYISWCLDVDGFHPIIAEYVADCEDNGVGVVAEIHAGSLCCLDCHSCVCSSVLKAVGYWYERRGYDSVGVSDLSASCDCY